MIRFDSIPLEIQQAMCTPMHRILAPTPLPNDPSKFTGSLYLGSLAAVCEKDLLRDHHITHLVQVLDVPWLPVSEKDGFSCYRIDILDQASSDLRPHLEDACNYIDRALRGGQSVLVHCQQVRQTSHCNVLNSQMCIPGYISECINCHCVSNSQSGYVL